MQNAITPTAVRIGAARVPIQRATRMPSSGPPSEAIGPSPKSTARDPDIVAGDGTERESVRGGGGLSLNAQSAQTHHTSPAAKGTAQAAIEREAARALGHGHDAGRDRDLLRAARERSP